MRQPVQVAVYCARKAGDDWEFLLLHRIPENFPIWQGVTGGVEDDEAPLTAARREFAEETGLEPVWLEQVDFTHRFKLQDRWRDKYGWDVDWITEHVFAAVVGQGSEPTLSPEEHDNYRWCRFDEAIGLLYWPSNRESLEFCRKYLRSRAAS
jgi:8-oxo-dGTP pyrophosphatase MutT (NUDIX family)